MRVGIPPEVILTHSKAFIRNSLASQSLFPIYGIIDIHDKRTLRLEGYNLVWQSKWNWLHTETTREVLDGIYGKRPFFFTTSRNLARQHHLYKVNYLLTTIMVLEEWLTTDVIQMIEMGGVIENNSIRCPKGWEGFEEGQLLSFESLLNDRTLISKCIDLTQTCVLTEPYQPEGFGDLKKFIQLTNYYPYDRSRPDPGPKTKRKNKKSIGVKG